MRTTPHTKQILLAVTGASGAIYAQNFIGKIMEQQHGDGDSPLPPVELLIIFTQTAQEVFLHEIGSKYDHYIQAIRQDACSPKITIIENNDFNCKYASGSNKLDCMIILPCSMGSLARISQGLSTDLIGRIADVQLKEKRPLVIVPRETPYNLIHLRNMTSLAEAGATILPASPSFYSKPQSLNELVDSFVERIMDIAEISTLSNRYRW